MNIVFWFLILLAAAALWYACLPLFIHIGSAAKDAAEEIKEELKGDSENE